MSDQNLNAGNQDTTKLVNPPKTDTPKQDAAKGPKLVKIEILRDCNVNLPGKPSQEIAPMGALVEVTESEAKRLLAIKYRGQYGFTGEKTGDELPKQTLKVARLWKEKTKKSELEELDSSC